MNNNTITTQIFNTTEIGVFNISVFENPEIISTNVVVTINTDYADKIHEELNAIDDLTFDEAINCEYEIDLWYTYTGTLDTETGHTLA